MQNFFKSKMFKILFVCTAFLCGMISFEISTGKPFFIEKVISTTVRPFSTSIVNIHYGVLNFFGSFFNGGKLKEENELLKEEIAKTRQKVANFNNIKIENDQLKQALKIQETNKNFKVEIANFVGRNPNDFYGFTINIGKNKEVTEGDLVLTKNGLVGVITKVFNTYSNVSSILGLDVQIPAIDSERDEKGIVGGNSQFSKQSFCVMQHLSKSTKCKVGDLISTFGNTSYPENIPIGKIKEIRTGKNGMSSIAIIEPFENLLFIKNLFVIKKPKKS